MDKVEEQTLKAVAYRPGSLVKVISSITAKDFDGNEIVLPEGTQGTVVEVSDLIGHLEIECILSNDLAIAVVRYDQVELLWQDRD